MLAEALRLIRVFHDLKQNELADRLGMSASFISEIEKGHKIPSIDIIERYAREFKIPASSILFFSEQLEKKGARTEARTRSAIAEKVLSFLQLVENKTK